jgi:hypothetical protein
MGIVTRITEDLTRIKPTDSKDYPRVKVTRNENVQILQVILRKKYELHDTCGRTTSL